MSKYIKITEMANVFLSLSAISPKQKEYKKLYEEIVKSDPDLLEKSRQNNRERQRRYQEKHKNDPKLIERNIQNRKDQWSDMKNIINDKQSLVGLLIKLRRQIAEYKYNIIRHNKPQEVIDNFTNYANKIYEFIEKAKKYTQDHTIDIIGIINDCEQLKNNTAVSSNINNTINDICNQLHNEFDNKNFK